MNQPSQDPTGPSEALPVSDIGPELQRRLEVEALRQGGLVLPHLTIAGGEDVRRARRKLAENLKAITAWIRLEGDRCAAIDHDLFAGAATIDRFAEEVDVP